MTRFWCVWFWIPLVVMGLLSSQVSARTFAYIPSYGDDRVVRLATSDNTSTSIELSGGPYGAAVMPDGSYVLVTCRDNDTLARIRDEVFDELDTETILSLDDEMTGDIRPTGVAIEPSGRFAYVANSGIDEVWEINLSTFAVSDRFEVGNEPMGVAAYYDEETGTIEVYVANYQDGTVSKITDGSVSTIVGIGNNPLGVAITPDGRFLYVADYNSGFDGSIYVVRTGDNSIISTISVGLGPWGVAVGSQGTIVHVTSSETFPGRLTLIRVSDNAVIGTVSLGLNPLGVAVPANGDFAYAVNQSDNSISHVDSVELTAEEIGVDLIDGAFALGAFIGGTPPAAPSEFEGVAETHSKIELSWRDNATDELGYKIERREEGEDTFEQVARTGVDSTGYTDGGLDSNKTYAYRIRAYNEASDSDYVTMAENVTTLEGEFSWCFINTLMH